MTRTLFDTPVVAPLLRAFLRRLLRLLGWRVEGALSGPRPLRVKGKATFEILWWDVSIGFDKTLIQGEKPPRPEPVEVLPRLKEANRRGRAVAGRVRSQDAAGSKDCCFARAVRRDLCPHPAHRAASRAGQPAIFASRHARRRKRC